MDRDEAAEADIRRIMYEQNVSRVTAEYVHDTRVSFEKRRDEKLKERTDV